MHVMRKEWKIRVDERNLNSLRNLIEGLGLGNFVSTPTFLFLFFLIFILFYIRLFSYSCFVCFHTH
jgi:hypothetical protein